MQYSDPDVTLDLSLYLEKLTVKSTPVNSLGILPAASANHEWFLTLQSGLNSFF